MKPEGGKRILIALVVSAMMHWGVFSKNYFEIDFSEKSKKPENHSYSVTWKIAQKQEHVVTVTQPVKHAPSQEYTDASGTNNIKKSPAYFASKELSVRPYPLEPVVVPLPEGSEPFSGNVILEILLSKDGSVDSISATRSNLPAHFSEIAIESFRFTRFSPGYLNGTPVPTRMMISVDFVSSKASPENR